MGQFVDSCRVPGQFQRSNCRLPMHLHPDWRRIEVVDQSMAEVLRQKTADQRIAIGFGLWRSVRKSLQLQLAARHPEWDQRQVEREVARRMSHGAVLTPKSFEVSTEAAALERCATGYSSAPAVASLSSPKAR